MCFQGRIDICLTFGQNTVSKKRTLLPKIEHYFDNATVPFANYTNQLDHIEPKEAAEHVANIQILFAQQQLREKLFQQPKLEQN